MKMNEITKRVVKLLKAYPSMKRRIEQLRFEIDHYYTIDESELIESLALGASADGQGFKYGGHPSDKTMAIALQYKGIKNRIESEALGDIRSELRMLEAEVTRLEFYVSLLDKLESDILRLKYFEKRS